MLRQLRAVQLVVEGFCANMMTPLALIKMVKKEQAVIYFPRPEFCADFGAMIAFAGCRLLLHGVAQDLEIFTRPRLPTEAV